MSVSTNSGVLFLDFDSLDRGDLNLTPLQAVAPLRCLAFANADDASGEDADAWCVIVNKVILTRDYFAAHPNLRLVCIAATGTNNVDIEAAAEYGVAVVHCQGYCTDTLAQHVLMLILALCRSLPQYQADVARGDWSRSPMFCLLNHPIREVGGMKLGILGYGAIGQRVSELASALGMSIVIGERPGQQAREGRVSFEDMLSSCDVVSLHCPLTSETEGMIDEDALRRMRPDALLINTARGGLVKEEALVKALREGRIAGAAVDTVSSEPPPADNPLIEANLPNLIITPHCAWGSRQARQNVVQQTAENIAAFLNSERLRRVV